MRRRRERGGRERGTEREREMIYLKVVLTVCFIPRYVNKAITYVFCVGEEVNGKNAIHPDFELFPTELWGMR